MSEKIREAQAVYEALGDAELHALDLVQQRLALAEVDVTIAHCDYLLLNDLPEELRTPLALANASANEVTSMDMKLVYDRAEMQFHPNDLLLRMDNGVTMSFNRLAQIIISPTARDRLYLTRLYTAAQQSLLQGPDELLVQESFVNELLSKLGVTIPPAPERASWDALHSTLRTSNRWAAVAVDIVPLPRGQQLYIEERYDGRGYTGDKEVDTTQITVTETVAEISEDPFTPVTVSDEFSIGSVPVDLDAHITEIGIALDEPTVIPGEYTSLKLTLLSDTPEDQPRSVGIQRAQVIYNQHPVTGRLIRHEISETSKLVLPKLAIVRHLSAAMIAALEIK
jgi:hypothetical protein